MQSYKLVIIFIFFLGGSVVQAHNWDEHLEDIEDLQRAIVKSQQEMEVLVEKKKNTREQARIEQTLQRIVEIHAELISLRKKEAMLDMTFPNAQSKRLQILFGKQRRVLD